MNALPWIGALVAAALTLGLFARRLIDTLERLVAEQQETNALLAAHLPDEVTVHIDGRQVTDDVVTDLRRRAAWR